MEPDDTGYDLDADLLAYEAEARREADDQMFIAQLSDMVDARSLGWVLVELARLECREMEQTLDLLTAVMAVVEPKDAP